VRLKKFLQNNRWSILWGLFILSLTSIPGSVLPDLPSYIDLLQPDKFIHVAVFAVFFILLEKGFRKSGNPDFIQRSGFFWAFMTGLILGAGTELLQEFVIPNRLASPWDFIANVAGIFGGYGIARVVKTGRIEH